MKEQELKLIWYSFGIKAKEVLSFVQKVELDNVDIEKFEKAQEQAISALDKLDKDLQEILRKYPD